MDVAALQERLDRLFAGHLGITVLEASEDGIRAELQAREELCTLPGTVHGGALMGFADTLGAVSTVLNLPPGASGTTTIESKTNFFRRADVNGKIFGECTALHKGRTTMVWQTRITNEEGKLLALTTQTQMVLQG